ncbi:Lrp/AsnC family transcriptional regulator [Brevundimonas sp. SORGH_AS_0993]|uniref:Lrp/AsnC family transcriptional regulator n=1 Tax=Brevundimonas sp. SORGH_AS_0993 TaxID=3041794 RepID=UPI0027838EDE|nr:Lrp/AsnC family transcriptional regulator [Brevundimonas sp. SORGH_AS_0993]MDQ1155377.1 Lrp/AsnC family leucine-responsive transcriptional regulator [Brevundimonas sp. SORGH_AS_0993]
MTNFVALDDFDRKLLARVRRNTLEPARVTAEAVGLSESAVLRRLRRLRAEGVIAADVALIDPARLAPRIVVQVLVEMTTQDRKVMETFQRAMKASPEVQGCWDVTGETDYLVMVAVPSMQAYEAFGIRELVPDKGVRGFKSMIVIREVVGFDPARAALGR